MNITPTENLVFKWKGTRFVSSTVKTEQFKSFAKDFKKAIVKELPPYMKAVNWNTGHFYLSGFFKNLNTDAFVYFSISDVRFFQDSWITEVLIRTAEGEKDYSGGVNRYTDITNLVKKAVEITGGTWL